MSNNNLNNLDKKIILKFICNNKLPGAYMLAHNLNDDKKYSYSYNYSEDGNDIFRLASMTKLFTSIAALQLIESKKIKLDDSLNNIMPEMVKIPILGENNKIYFSDNAITLRHLLTHTSGFGYPFLSKKLNNYARKNYSLTNLSEIERYEILMNLPRLFEPGKQFLYGTNTDWVGRLVEKISNMNLNDYFKTKIIDPLNLSHTFFNVPKQLETRISPYFQKKNNIFHKINDSNSQETNLFSGGGSLKGSANDYLRLLQCLLNSGELDGSIILSRKSVDLMFKNHLLKGINLEFEKIDTEDSNTDGGMFDENDFWGLAFALVSNPKEKFRTQGTGYWAGIYNSYYTIDYKNKIAIVYFSQFKPFNDKNAFGLYKLFESIIYKKYLN